VDVDYLLDRVPLLVELMADARHRGGYRSRGESHLDHLSHAEVVETT